jgi:hypothetical protein
MCPEVDSTSKNEYQGIPLGVKAAGAWDWRPTNRTSRKFGALTYPEPPWALAACCGRDLTFNTVVSLKRRCYVIIISLIYLTENTACFRKKENRWILYRQIITVVSKSYRTHRYIVCVCVWGRGAVGVCYLELNLTVKTQVHRLCPNSGGQMCFGIQNFSEISEVIQCTYHILRNIPAGFAAANINQTHCCFCS